MLLSGIPISRKLTAEMSILAHHPVDWMKTLCPFQQCWHLVHAEKHLYFFLLYYIPGLILSVSVYCLSVSGHSFVITLSLLSVFFLSSLLPSPVYWNQVLPISALLLFAFDRSPASPFSSAHCLVPALVSPSTCCCHIGLFLLCLFVSEYILLVTSVCHPAFLGPTLSGTW